MRQRAKDAQHLGLKSNSLTADTEGIMNPTTSAFSPAQRLAAFAAASPVLVHPSDEPLPGMDYDPTPALDRLTGEPELLAKLAASRSLIVDLDDTLTVNIALFSVARHEYLELLQSQIPDLDVEACVTRWEQIDHGRIPELGYTPERWKGSAQLHITETLPACSDELRAKLTAAADLALGVGVWYPGARETLVLLQAADVECVLLTKGCADKQAEKITAHDLAALFTATYIVDRKDAAVIATCARSLTHPAVMIGDSSRSDIMPAVEAGLAAVHVDHAIGCWEGDADHGVQRVPSFADAVLAACLMA